MSKNSLNTTTDNELIRMVKLDNSDEAFEEIRKRYENVFLKICQKYVPALSSVGVNPQDIFDEKQYIIYHCVLSFNIDKKAKLSTWIGNYARYLCLNSINARKFIVPTSEEAIKNYTEKNSINPTTNLEELDYVVNILEQLADKRVEEVFKYRYLSDKKMIWSKIAKKMNISVNTAVNLHNRGMEMLRKKIQSKTISDLV